MLKMPLLFCLVLASATGAIAAENRYLCVIEKVYFLDENGLTIAPALFDGLRSQLFEVNRTTGAITGAQLENVSYDVTVISPGDSQNSFQAYWIVRGTGDTSIRWVEINEWVIRARKPFRAVVQSWIYTGHCE